MSIRDLANLFEYNNHLNKSLKDLKKIQNKKFLKIFNSAYSNIKFYNKSYKDQFTKINSINEIDNLPLLSKEVLRNLPLEEIINIKNDKNKLICRQTSGSTGIPLNVYIDKHGSSIDFVIWRRSNIKRGVSFKR